MPGLETEPPVVVVFDASRSGLYLPKAQEAAEKARWIFRGFHVQSHAIEALNEQTDALVVAPKDASSGNYDGLRLLTVAEELLVARAVITSRRESEFVRAQGPDLLVSTLHRVHIPHILADWLIDLAHPQQPES